MTNWNPNWHPDKSNQLNEKPNVRKTAFGDTYGQRTSLGISKNPRIWTLKFTKNQAEILEMLQFLEEKGGVTAFEWTDPYSRPGKYVCLEWNVDREEPGVHTLSARFEQVFDANNH